ncbi:zinc-binding metallopeptidase [Bacteroides clarus]|jgi:substrate import-associated zinc metallohydrolase lipoprotein|uniref:zinc-binding metallopeptidase n=1 Tax=Bacteroides clarus TaxID=626929 RepID=UPI0011DD5A92|nr:putative zinc-binding metallopeptidase [Bacteroides clarus]
MKRYIVYNVLALSFFLLFSACNQDTDIDYGNSIFTEETEAEKSAFDKWVLSNYTNPYNILLKYRMEDKESDMTHVLVPASYEKSVVLAKIVKHVWLEAYDEATGNPNFLRHYVPKILHFVGSPAYEDNGTMVVGTAEGGMKITLYNVNDIDPDNISVDMLNEYYFQTMHHEFAHILHQTKNFDPAYERITESSYVGSDWYIKTDPTTGQTSSRSNKDAWKEGFVTAYAMSESREDFVENIAMYVTNTKEYWDNMLTEAGETGRILIQRKFDIVYEYMESTWGINLDNLRDIVLRRQKEISRGVIDLSVIE